MEVFNMLPIILYAFIGLSLVISLLHDDKVREQEQKARQAQQEKLFKIKSV